MWNVIWPLLEFERHNIYSNVFVLSDPKMLLECVSFTPSQQFTPKYKEPGNHNSGEDTIRTCKYTHIPMGWTAYIWCNVWNHSSCVIIHGSSSQVYLDSPQLMWRFFNTVLCSFVFKLFLKRCFLIAAMSILTNLTAIVRTSYSYHNLNQRLISSCSWF